jgi:hypothetical protein
MKTFILPTMMLALLATPALSASSVTVKHGKTPDPTYIDLGTAGDSTGDQRIWEFGGQTAEGEPVRMDWLMITTGQPDAASGLESRMTSAVFAFGSQTSDRILVQGIGFYPTQGSTVKVAAELERAIIGGTGKYAGVTGSVVTTHLEDGTWQHVFSIE